jgi:hypothetical protein
MIGENGDARGTVAEHAQHRRKDASNGSDFPAVLISHGWQRVVVPEHLVCAVDGMNVQKRNSTSTL